MPSTVRQICQEIGKDLIHAKAIKWDNGHEEKALKDYKQVMSCTIPPQKKPILEAQCPQLSEDKPIFGEGYGHENILKSVTVSVCVFYQGRQTKKRLIG